MSSVHLKLPATSGNLGPGFDTLALALEIFLEVDAARAAEFAIEAEGRDCALCGNVRQNLVIDTYKSIMEAENRPSTPLMLRVKNEIPLGMGCGSSAAARLAGVALANHFGELGWDSNRIMAAAAEREGHPDNVAGCWQGGLTIAAGCPPTLTTATISPPGSWKAMIVLPERPVATKASRAVLPTSYPGSDAIVNVQNVALLVAAFALRRADLVRRATADRLHQPYREQLCPLLPALAPLAEQHGVLSVTLSGAGPSVLVLADSQAELKGITEWIHARTGISGSVEIVETRISQAGASMQVTG